MTSLSLPDVTGLLHAWGDGDRNAFRTIVQVVYPELRKIARRCLAGERTSHTIQATALVHEAFIRLIDLQRIQWQDRAHFFAVSARMMRRILIEYARRRQYAKRGGGSRQVDLTEALLVSSEMGPELLRLSAALDELAEFDPRKAQVVEMRYFGGLTANEIASVLGVSLQTVNRDWSLAKAWLAREISNPEFNGRSIHGTVRR